MAWNTANPLFADVKSPITPRQLASIDKTIGRVQFSGALTERDHQKLARRLLQFSGTTLRVYELFGKPEADLHFLKYYHGLKRLYLDLHRLDSVDGLEQVADSLEYFDFGATKRRQSLKFLAQFPKLKGLRLAEHKLDIQAVADLKELEELALYRITLEDLSLVAALPKLWSLTITLGGTKNLGALARAKSLKNLELRQIHGLSDLSVVSQIPSLQRLVLDSLRNVTKIPSLIHLQKLRRITLGNMKGIQELGPLVQAKALEDAILIQTSHLVPEAFEPLQKHKSLKALGFGLGSDKKNRAVAAMFPHLEHTIHYPFIFGP